MMSRGTASKTNTDLVLGVAIVALALVIAFVWIPADVDSGIFEKVRRRLEIGDAFAPMLATALLGLGGLMLIVEALRSTSNLRIGATSLVFVVGLLTAFFIFTVLTKWTGPVLVSVFGAEGADYRILRDTVPWKYIGFVLGGTFLVTTLISFMERRVSLNAVLIGLVACLAMIALYDLPFDDLLLPPNGDF